MEKKAYLAPQLVVINIAAPYLLLDSSSWHGDETQGDEESVSFGGSISGKPEDGYLWGD